MSQNSVKMKQPVKFSIALKDMHEHPNVQQKVTRGTGHGTKYVKSTLLVQKFKFHFQK